MQRVMVFVRDRRGATLVEYAMICALVALAGATGFLLVVGSVEGMMDTIAAAYPGGN
jgi:Flp pilus assembly pilin Flp